MEHKQRIAAKTVENDTNDTEDTEKETIATKGIDEATYMAVIALALKAHLEDKHDVESGIITIKPKQTRWNAPRF